MRICHGILDYLIKSGIKREANFIIGRKAKEDTLQIVNELTTDPAVRATVDALFSLFLFNRKYNSTG